MKAFNLILSLIMICSLSACGESEKPKKQKPVVKKVSVFDKAKETRLRFAVSTAVNNIGMMQSDVGYQSFTPDSMADKIIGLQKSAGRFNKPSKPKKNEISYVKGKVKKPWQVVLVPEKRTSMLIIKGYGKNIKTPIVETKVKINRYN